MQNFYEAYQRGSYHEIYDKLLALGEQVYDASIYREALSTMQAMMQRVRFNVELLIPRLHSMGYQFHKGGFWEDLSEEESTQIEETYPIFQPPTEETKTRVSALEDLTGPLPLALKCWFEEVGNVNLIGLFQGQERGYGPTLDPLYIDSVESVLETVTKFAELGLWEDESELILAPDGYHKYGYSGAGNYNILLPCKAVDSLLRDEPHQTTFVNYLRICFQWGGFPGLEQENRLTPEELAFLTDGLLPF